MKSLTKVSNSDQTDKKALKIGTVFYAQDEMFSVKELKEACEFIVENTQFFNGDITPNKISHLFNENTNEAGKFLLVCSQIQISGKPLFKYVGGDVAHFNMIGNVTESDVMLDKEVVKAEKPSKKKDKSDEAKSTTVVINGDSGTIAAGDGTGNTTVTNTTDADTTATTDSGVEDETV